MKFNLFKKKKEITLIGKFDFKDIKVKVYNDPYTDKNAIYPIWQMRNPDTCYNGYLYLDHKTGKVTYPEDAIIPKQTDRDRELLPKAVVTGYKKINKKLLSFLLPKLENEYELRNKHIL
jgi:hypothetical protein